MGKKSSKTRQYTSAQCVGIIDDAEKAAKHAFDAWQAKYLPVEREILEQRARREESKRRRATARKRAFADLCEITDGLAVYSRKYGVSLDAAEREMNSRSRRRNLPYALVFLSLFEDAWSIADFIRRELTKRIDKARHEAIRSIRFWW